MSFEAQIPAHIATCERLIAEAQREQALMLHECDCSYCDRQGEIDDEYYSEAQYKALTRDIRETERLIKSLKAHAKLHGVPSS